MKNYIILTDSTSDLCKQLREEYNIEYVAMNISYDNKEYKANLDWEEYSAQELYDLMRNGKRIRTTQVPYNVYLEKFEQCAKSNVDILYISCSSALSGSVNVARTVKDEVLEKYPDAKINIVDSLISSLGQGSLAIKAAKLRSEGKTIDEVTEYLEQNKLKTQQVATVGSLEYLKRAGRVKATKAFFGNLFGVKPIIMSDAKGQNYAFKKIKGRRASLLYLVEYLKENIRNSEEQMIYISHADTIEDATFVKDHILKEVKCKGVFIDYIGPIVGSSVGPGTIIVFYDGEKVSIIGEE